ncbi:superoxide dismutase [Ni] [Thermodesulfobacteriota bacterium]
MKRFISQIAIGLAFFALLVNHAAAHCEIPCGIYDDEARIVLIREHIATIEKSMHQIKLLENEKNHQSTQLIRWVMNKEQHANELQKIVTQYFMTQRIKLNAKNYEKKLNLLHQMLLFSMKCKQIVDQNNIDTLRNLVNEFNALYFDKK